MTTKKLDDSSLKRRDFLKLPVIAGAGLIVPTACDDSSAENGTTQAADASQSYVKLADALDKLPNGFPRTNSKVEIELLKKIFLPEEAWLAAQLTGTMEPVADIAKRTGLREEETAARLGACWTAVSCGVRRSKDTSGWRRLSLASTRLSWR